MSELRSVTLVYLPGSNFLIGTFDASRVTEWWVSSGFTDVETVDKGIQLYGSIHVAICKKLDGTWSIFKSDDYAQSWYEVLNFVHQIYDIVKVLPGRAIINTSNGFYETVDAGKTWQLVLGLPSAPVASAIANIGGGDILICTDGRYIWRSTDLARSWLLVCDQAAVSYRGWYKIIDQWGSDDYGFSWTRGSPLTAAVAGANGEVLCAYGPWLTISVDYGKTWSNGSSGNYGVIWTNCWDGYFPGFEGLSEINGNVFPDRSLIYDKFPSSATDYSRFSIKQIVLSSASGNSISDVKYVIRVDDNTATTGQLYSMLFYGHHGRYMHPTHHAWADDPSPTFHLVSRSVVGATDTNKIASYELPMSGDANNIDRVVISVQSKYEGDVLKPFMKVSYDGGKTWEKLDLTLIEFELPTDNGSIIHDETFVNNVWVWGLCQNEGYWQDSSAYWRRLQSYDMDWVLQPYETLESTYDMRVKIELPVVGYSNYDMAVYVLGRHLVSMLHDSLIEVTNEKSYLNTTILEQRQYSNYATDEITEIDREMPYEMILWLEKTSHKPYVMSYHTEVSSSASYAMTAWFGQVTVPDIDWASPQWWNILFPDTTKAPLNSRGGY